MGNSKMAKAAPKKKTTAKKAPAKKAIAKKSAKKAAPKKTAKKAPAKKGSAKKGDKKEKVKRAPSAYNIFMKKELEKLKKSQPKLDHKGRFAAAAANWSKNKK